METITVELEHDLLHSLMLMAHEQDITLNQLMNQIVKAHIEKLNAEQ